MRLLMLAACAAALTLPAAASAAVPAGNLVVNGGAEVGPAGDDAASIAGWTKPAGSARFAAKDYETDPPGRSGCRYFYGGPFSSDTYATQVVDVSGAADQIDGGGVTMRYAALLGAIQEIGDDDYASASFTYLNGAGNPLDSYPLTGNNASAVASTRLDAYASSKPVDVGTRSIRVTLHASGGLNEASNALIDDVGLTLDGTNPAIAPAEGCRAPTATTGDATDVTSAEATLNATFDPVDEQTHAHIEWGSSDLFGLTAANTDLAGGSGPHPISERITGLNPGQTYYYRVVTSNAYGSQNGETRSFTTTAAPGPGPGPGPGGTTPPPTGLGPFTPILKIAKQKIAKIIVSGFKVRLIWTTNHLAKSTITYYVLKGRKKVKWAKGTDPGFYGGGTGLTRAPKGKLARYFRSHRKVKILVTWSSVTKEGLTASGKRTLTVRR